MTRSLAILLCTLLPPGATLAQPPAPIGPPPTLIVVSKTIPTKGLIVFAFYEKVQEQMHVKEIINVNGKAIEVLKLVTRNVYKQIEITMDIADGRVITPDGKQLPVDEVWKRAKAGTVIALSADGNVPHQAYLRALNAQTLIIVQTSMKKATQPEPECNP